MIELLILNKDYEIVYNLDFYESLIWTDRYYQYGDFEILTAIEHDILEYAVIGNYILNKSSEHIMIIEERSITTDVDSGSKLIFKGRSLESILDRRIIWKQTVMKGTFQSSYEKILNENIIRPEIEARKIPNFRFVHNTDNAVNELKVDTQYTGDNLYEMTRDECYVRRIGFKITLDDDNIFTMQFYAGLDRSYAQEKNAYVIFSPGFENIVSSNYYESNSNVKNVALVAGEGEGLERKTVTIGEVEGLERKELYVDARDISSTKDDGTSMNREDYDKLLTARGEVKLSDYIYVESFEGEVEATKTFVLNRDFNVGDVVQIVNEYGIEARSRVIEVIISEDTSGIKIIPTFGAV